MANLNFPANPNDGDEYNAPTGVVYVYVAAKTRWEIKDAGFEGGTSITVSDTPPANPEQGDRWLDSTTGLLWTWYQDVDSGQWICDVAQDNGGGLPDAPSDGNLYGRKDGAWAVGGGGAVGGGNDEIIYLNDQGTSGGGAGSYTIAGDKNAMTTGPLVISAGDTITVEATARWVII
jgi:hypothetical protein